MSKQDSWIHPPTFDIDLNPGVPLPKDVYSIFLNARAMAMEQFSRAGWTPEQIFEILNFKDVNHCKNILVGIKPSIKERGTSFKLTHSPKEQN